MMGFASTAWTQPVEERRVDEMSHPPAPSMIAT